MNTATSNLTRLARRFGLLFGLAALTGLTAPSPQAHAQGAPRDIVDTAAAAGSFKTLVTAVQAAGLVDTLKGPGPYTVFAPTDEAFAKLPAGTLDGLLKDPDRLRAVLTYHVVPGRVTAADVTRLPSARTVQGAELAITTTAGVKINNATVTQADVMASNGVIHVIDNVLLPPAAQAAQTPSSLPRAGTADFNAYLPLLLIPMLLIGGFWLRRAGRRV